MFSTTIPTPSDIDAYLWAQLDAVVLSWIYATISTDLLMAIFDEKSTAMDNWTRLRDLFQRYNTHQNSLSTAMYSSQPQSLNLLSSYVEQQPMPPRQKRKVRSASSGFPTFVNVKQLEIIFLQFKDDCLSLTSLIEACPSVHTFKLKLPLYTSLINCPNSAPKYAQVDAIRSHQRLQAVEYVGYAGCAAGSKLALFLTRHAPMLNKFVFDPHRPLNVGKPITCVYSSKYRDKLASARSHAELLAKRIRGSVDVVIL